MLADHLYFNFCLYIVAGLCLPSGIYRLKWPKLYYFYMIITDMFVFITFVTIGANLLTPNVPLAKRCYSGFTTLASALAITKLLACYTYKHKFSKYLDLWDDLIETDIDDILKEALLKNKKAIKKISTCVFIFMVGPMVPWGSLPLFIKILSYVIPSLEESYNFIVVPAQYPFDPLTSPGFELATLSQGIGALVVNAKLMAYDCFIYGLISCQIVQFKYLKNQFKDIAALYQLDGKTGTSSQYYSIEQKKTRDVQLIQWVQKHSNLIKICHSFNQLYSPVLLLQFFFNILILCSNAFVVAAAHLTKLELIFSASYVVGTIIQLYVLCWLGEEIAHQSGTLTNDGFWQEWYLHPRYVCSNIRIIFERTKIPVKISAFGAFHLSIETFKSIVGTAYSYFMVLNQIKKEG